jgi:hypothetical protein
MGVTTKVRNLMCFVEEGINCGGPGSLRALCMRHSFGATLEGHTYNYTLPQIKITSHRELDMKMPCYFVILPRIDYIEKKNLPMLLTIRN